VLVITCILGVGIVVGLLVRAGAARWPTLEAPRVSGEGTHRRLLAHPHLARVLRTGPDERVATVVVLAGLAVVIVAVAAVLGVLLWFIRTNLGPARLDMKFAEFGAHHATTASTRFMKWMSLLGGTAGTILVALVVGAFEYRRLPSKAIPAFLALTAVGQFAVANGIKWIVDRARPTIDPLTGFSSTSFPSGHATASAATFAAAALLLGRARPRWARSVLAGVAAGIAAAVASTRVLLGVHWFTDVVAGLLLGWAWFAVCSIAFGGRRLRFGAPVVAAESLAETTPTATGSS
jgi:undecaprenyl-diphosphatase